MKRRYSLQAARKRARLTQEQLAARAGLRQGMVSKLECGKVTDPRFSTVLSLARALRLDPGALRFGPQDGGVA